MSAGWEVNWRRPEAGLKGEQGSRRTEEAGQEDRGNFPPEAW